MTVVRRPAASLLPLLALAGAACAAGDESHRDSDGTRHHAAADVAHDHATQHGIAGNDAQHLAGAVGHATHAARTTATRANVVHDADAGTLTIELHPIPLPPADGAAHVMPVTPLLHVAMPFAAHLTRFDVELTDGAGRPMPQDVLHHVNVMLPGRRDLFRPIMQRLVAAGEETDPIALPWPLGLRLDEGEELATYAMLHNGSATDYGDVTLRLHFRYAGTSGRMAVQPLFIDASPPPGPASWDLPPGRSVRQWEGRPAVSGRILGLGGHLHRYGRELIFEDVTTGTVLFRTRPQLDDEGNVVAMPQQRFLARMGLPLRSDRTYRITAVYNNPTGRTIRDGGMGALGGVIRVRPDRWPAADPSDPLYARDADILSGAIELHAHH